ncbi:MAG: glutamine-hydrolyzing carbamoyl-phosphate synthase small subunit [Elusimicrobia bacterium]|nr:glutamine-hydrolyzing carbamoyl-phosphate synthase small subunit [Candidatus Obscuribacterium magneticum]
MSVNKNQKAYLVLATGRVFQGMSFGSIPKDPSASPKEITFGEVVFNTSLTGYQEIITDPSYYGQIVAMTPSHIGNTGINAEDVESRKIFLSGFVVQELSGIVSNWRATETLDSYFQKAGIAGLTGVDTRALTRHIRMLGAVTGLIAPEGADLVKAAKIVKDLPGLETRDLVKDVTVDKPYSWSEGSREWLDEALKTKIQKDAKKKKVVVVDFGVKKNILRSLVDFGCDVTVVPASTKSKEIMNLKPDGVLFSNGPGDPAAVDYGIQTIRDLIKSNREKKEKGEKQTALFGICLGHQMMGLALGGKTFKMKFGHHGSNHPIKELGENEVDITSQNHGFSVTGEKTSSGDWVLKGDKDVAVTHLNLNDNAIEGLKHKTMPLFSVQYHPEASAGPHDAKHLFRRFMKLMEGEKN